MVNNFQNKFSSLNSKDLKALYKPDKISAHQKCQKAKILLTQKLLQRIHIPVMLTLQCIEDVPGMG